MSGQRGTLFWHAHLSWIRATVYGPLIILPKSNVPNPFGKPYEEVPIIFGINQQLTVLHLYSSMSLTINYSILPILQESGGMQILRQSSAKHCKLAQAQMSLMLTPSMDFQGHSITALLKVWLYCIFSEKGNLIKRNFENPILKICSNINFWPDFNKNVILFL